MAFWDEEKFVGEVKKDDFAKYVINLCKKNGKEYITIREWYITSSNPVWRPSKNGMSLPPGAVTAAVVKQIQQANQGQSVFQIPLME